MDDKRLERLENHCCRKKLNDQRYADQYIHSFNTNRLGSTFVV
jgi:hypothetical protein